MQGVRQPDQSWLHGLAVVWILACALPRFASCEPSQFPGETLYVGSSFELWQAFQNQTVSTIFVTEDISLTRDIWAGDDGPIGVRDFMIILQRNVTVAKDPDLPARPKIDLDYMRFRVGSGVGLRLVVKGIHFLRSARDPEEQLALSFFGIGESGRIDYVDVVADVAVDFARSLRRLASLARLPRPDPKQYTDILPVNQSLEILDANAAGCVGFSGEACPVGAIWLEDFANVIQVFYKALLVEWQAVLVHKNTFLRAVDTTETELKSSEEITGRRTVVARTMYDLHQFVTDPTVARVNLWNDLIFDISSWPNREGRLIKQISLDHDVEIVTHPLTARNFGPATLDLNMGQSAIVAEEGVTLSLTGIMMDRVSVDPYSALIIPFFQMKLNSTLILEDVVSKMPVNSVESLGYLMASVIRIGNSYNVDVSKKSEVSVVDDLSQCKAVFGGECDGLLRIDNLAIPACTHDDYGFKFGFEAHSAKVESADVETEWGMMVVRDSHFVAWDVTKREVVKQEDVLFTEQGFVLVATETALRTAMANETVKGAYLVQNLNLTEEMWPAGKDAVKLKKDFDIRTHPSEPVAFVLDLDFMAKRVQVGVGQTLHLEFLNVSRVSRDAENLHYVPFFMWSDNSTIYMRHVLSQMAIEPNRVGDLDAQYIRSFEAIPGPEWYDDPFANLTHIEVLRTADCLLLAEIPCPDKGLYIIEGIQDIALADVYPRKAMKKGSAVFWAQFVLIVGDDVEERELLTRRQAELEALNAQVLQESNLGAVETGGGKEEGELTAKVMIIVYVVVGGVVLLTVLSGFALLVYKRMQLQKLGILRGKSTTGRSEEKVTREHRAVAPELLGDVDLGPLMGVGGFARVYRAAWNGATVAVKVILHRGGDTEANIEREAILSTMLRHPNLVQGYHFATRSVKMGETASATEEGTEGSTQHSSYDLCTKDPKDPKDPKDQKDSCTGFPKSKAVTSLSSTSSDRKTIIAARGRVNPASSNSSAETPSSLGAASSVLFSDSSATATGGRCEEPGVYRETWLVQEFCDVGSLMETLQSGRFNLGREDSNLVHIIWTCQDIARGMKYLHDNKVIHGDLKSSNILLQRSATDPRGFVAKVADFGLSRQMMSDRSHLSTSSFGTVTHMPPEVLMQGHLSLRADVYSFGMIMWEIIAGELPFRNMMQMEVMRKVVLERRRPEFPPWVNNEYKILVEQCWSHDPRRRLTFLEVLTRLQEILPPAPAKDPV